jgi:hypothetical protein
MAIIRARGDHVVLIVAVVDSVDTRRLPWWNEWITHKCTGGPCGYTHKSALWTVWIHTWIVLVDRVDTHIDCIGGLHDSVDTHVNTMVESVDIHVFTIPKTTC